MKFRRGDIAEHILTGEKLLIVTVMENFPLIKNDGSLQTVTTVYGCRTQSRLDVIFNFDEIELKEVGTEKI
jgi:hypothetical protein